MIRNKTKDVRLHEQIPINVFKPTETNWNSFQKAFDT